jgi:hypothetical protein
VEPNDNKWWNLKQALDMAVDSYEGYLANQASGDRNIPSVNSLIALAADLKGEEHRVRSMGAAQQLGGADRGTSLSIVHWLVAVGLGMIGFSLLLESVFKSSSTWYKPFVIAISSAMLAFFFLLHAKIAEVGSQSSELAQEKARGKLDSALTLMLNAYLSIVPQLETRKSVESKCWMAGVAFVALAALSVIYGIGRPFVR